jgi:hypothetical protein
MNYYAVFIVDGGSERMDKIFRDFKKNLHTCANNVDVFKCEEPVFNESYALVEGSVFAKKQESYEADEEVKKIRAVNKARKESPPEPDLKPVDFMQHMRKK